MRVLVIVITLVLWCVLALGSAREGISQLESEYSLASGSSTNAAKAIAVSPSNPEAHYARARLLSDDGDLAKSRDEFERALALRPRDYFLWLELGRTRDQLNDEQGAVVALREAVRLAPFHSQPRWQLGNVLLRMGRFDEAFAELRVAASSDPALVPALIDLAWGANREDADAVIQATNFQTTFARIALARFFIRKGAVSEGLVLLRSEKQASATDRQTILQDLITSGRLKEAYELWADGTSAKAIGSVSNGDFESPISNEPGFGWRVANVSNVSFMLDTNSPYRGSRSLRLDFKGSSDPSVLLLSQLVIVQPNSRYRLNFTGRTQELVSGGPPVITVTSARGDAPSLAESKPLQTTNGWQHYDLEFSSGNADAVFIGIQRAKCAEALCPCFGSLWLDDLSLDKL